MADVTDNSVVERAPRYECRAGVRIKNFEGFAILHDITEEGLCMRSKTYVEIAPGERFSMRIIPEGDTDIGWFDLGVEVRWEKVTPDLFRCGFKIFEKPDNSAKQLRQYIDHVSSIH